MRPLSAISRFSVNGLNVTEWIQADAPSLRFGEMRWSRRSPRVAPFSLITSAGGDVLGISLCFESNDAVMVRRAGRDQAGRWTLVSDHDLRAPIPWSRESQVSGEVRWMARILT